MDRTNAPSNRVEMRRATSKAAMRDKVGTKKGKTKGPIPGKLKRYDARALGTARFDQRLRSFYDEIDLPEFKTALELAEDPRMKMFFYALSSPKMHEHTFAELCKRCKLTLREISELYRNHQLHRGMIRMMNHMPRVMEDTAQDAMSRETLCDRCEGTGKTPDSGVNRQHNSICPDCHGDGKIRIPGDKDARNLLFEAAGMKKGGGQNVNVLQFNSLPPLEDATRSFGTLNTPIDAQIEAVEAEEPLAGEVEEPFGPSGEAVEEAETPKNDDETQKTSGLPAALTGGGAVEGENAEIPSAEERFEGSGGAVEEAQRPPGDLSDLFGGPDPIRQLLDLPKQGS